MMINKSKNKILLVRVPEIETHSAMTDLRSVTVASLTVPLGVTYLAAVIRRDSAWDVEIADLYVEDYEKYIGEFWQSPEDTLSFIKNKLGKRVDDFAPDIVGFSALFMYQHKLVKELVESVKSNNPNLRIYAGGYATVCSEFVLEDIPAIDAIFKGESEKTIIEALEAESTGNSFSQIKGVAYRDQGSIVVNEGFNIVTDIEDLVYPAFDLIPLDQYKEIFGRVELPIMSTRGCPFDCNFCSAKQYSARSFRAPSPEYTINYIKYMHEVYGLEYLWVRDDIFNVRKEYCKAVLRGIIDSGIPLQWMDSSSFHLNSLDEEFLSLCKESGCSQIIMAVESGSQRVLTDIMNKRVDLDHAKKVADYCREIGIILQVYFVIGNPGETEEEIQQTVAFARELALDHCTFSVATPFPGTQYYEVGKANGFMDVSREAILNMNYMEATLGTNELPKERLKDLQYDANMDVNFLNNKIAISGGVEEKKKALEKFSRTAKTYSFHPVARLMRAYLLSNLGQTDDGIEVYKEVKEMIEGDPKIKKAYAKYFEWDTPPTNAYREWDLKVNQ